MSHVPPSEVVLGRDLHLSATITSNCGATGSGFSESCDAVTLTARFDSGGVEHSVTASGSDESGTQTFEVVVPAALIDPSSETFTYSLTTNQTYCLWFGCLNPVHEVWGTARYPETGKQSVPINFDCNGAPGCVPHVRVDATAIVGSVGQVNGPWEWNFRVAYDYGYLYRGDFEYVGRVEFKAHVYLQSNGRNVSWSQSTNVLDGPPIKPSFSWGCRDQNSADPDTSGSFGETSCGEDTHVENGYADNADAADSFILRDDSYYHMNFAYEFEALNRSGSWWMPEDVEGHEQGTHLSSVPWECGLTSNSCRFH